MKRAKYVFSLLALSAAQLCLANTQADTPPPTCDFRDTNDAPVCDIYSTTPPVTSCPGTSQDEFCYRAWLQWQRQQRCETNPEDPICVAEPEEAEA